MDEIEMEEVDVDSEMDHGEAIEAGVGIVQISVSDGIVFGLGTDGLVYRWDNIRGDWDLHSRL